MALNFNPFEKDKPAPTPKTKDKHSHYRVFDDPTQSTTPSADQATASDESSQEQTDYKQVTNGSQNGLQTDHKQTTSADENGLQTDHKWTTEKPKRTTQRTTQRITTRLQTDHKRTTNEGISALVGHERHLLLFIFDQCRITGELITEPLTLSRIKEELKNRSGSTAKTIIARLIDKKFISRAKAKTGRGGWMTFRLEREIFQQLLLETDYKRTTNGSQTGDKQTTKQTTQRTTELSSSSSSLRSISNKEELLTTSGPVATEQIDLNAEWQRIDYSPLTEIRFGRHQVVQIAREGKFTPEELQDSIYAFAFDLSENGKSKTITGVPLNYFMGILRRGPYAAPSNYESPDVRQKRLYLESKEQQRKKRQELNERLESVEFEEWLESLSLEQRAELVPPKDFAKPGSTAHNYQMREFFRENVWPELRAKQEVKLNESVTR